MFEAVSSVLDVALAYYAVTIKTAKRVGYGWR